ncbi:flavin-dependent amine oxidoreductase [Gelidibacter algens]|uniref:Flavin-dependent amine oxidoreductase n=1 Tax=Gelidibacter algens TaxID=49280 RepID=A0A1A7R5W0_9FLAO|nr:NAD(P)/FAD-dependent oxidoreductase [Gelidibacter algens]OBX26888.1 oxidoreductase [Gelidibacter algens]RAJ26429.1 flavin-dependent amine oxidoreductase [Gelidibacter algens]
MKKEQYHIHIIGGGVSGLVAAKVLEDHGYSPVIIEATDRVGGRVKTDSVEGYQLDRGFQVLLTAYPAAQNYLDFDALELQHFLPGATIFTNGQQKTLGDPLRDLSLLFPTLFSGIGTFSDKLRILKLNVLLKKSTLAEIFAKPEKTTFQYLVDFGFTEAMISKFFKPFFSGIFLEPELETSSRMFEFVYKMFGEGFAALPKAGIEAIPKHLKNNLKRTTFHFNTKVESIEDGTIVLANGTQLESHFTIIATEAGGLISTQKVKDIPWKSCDTLYFETPNRLIKKPLIGLIANKDALINNIFYHTSLDTNATGGKELLSVTIVKNHGLTSDALKKEVEKELQRYCGENAYRFIKHYEIAKALPKLADLKYNMTPSETRLNTRVFLAGDIQLNGSLNAAMLSGESAALGVIDALSNESPS